MNKNLIKSLVAVVLGATLSFGIIGCKKAEEEPNGGTGAGPKKSAEPNKMGSEPTPSGSPSASPSAEASPSASPSADGKMGEGEGKTPEGDGKMGEGKAPEGDGKMGGEGK